MYYTLPAYWSGCAKGQDGSEGIIKWNVLGPNKSIYLKTDDATQLRFPVVGIYEITISGSCAFNSDKNFIFMWINGELLKNSKGQDVAIIYVTQNKNWTPFSFNYFLNVTTADTYIQFSFSTSSSSNIVIQENNLVMLNAKFISS